MSELMKKEFGGRVRALREQAGLSTNKFALMVGLSKSFIIQIVSMAVETFPWIQSRE